MALQLTDYVMRPGAGKVGRPVRVRSNFFEVTSFPTQNLLHYDVTIDPPNAPPALYRKIWKAFEDTDGQGILKGIKTVYDGRKNVFAPKTLPLGAEHTGQFEVRLSQKSRGLRVLFVWHAITQVEIQDTDGPKRAAGTFKIRIKKAGEINMEELRRFLLGQTRLTPNCLTGERNSAWKSGPLSRDVSYTCFRHHGAGCAYSSHAQHDVLDCGPFFLHASG